MYSVTPQYWSPVNRPEALTSPTHAGTDSLALGGVKRSPRMQRSAC